MALDYEYRGKAYPVITLSEAVKQCRKGKTAIMQVNTGKKLGYIVAPVLTADDTKKLVSVLTTKKMDVYIEHKEA